jgi:hypothetical protein
VLNDECEFSAEAADKDGVFWGGAGSAEVVATRRKRRDIRKELVSFMVVLSLLPSFFVDVRSGVYYVCIESLVGCFFGVKRGVGSIS